jgi:hypothetical protein
MFRSLILVTLMMEAIRSSKTSVLTRATPSEKRFLAVDLTSDALEGM